LRVVVHDYVGYAFPAQLARVLASRRHDVLFLHCTSFTAGKGNVEPREGDPPTLAFGSVSVAGTFAKYDVRRRLAHERSTGRELARRVTEFRPDVVLSSNSPLVVQGALQRAARACGAGFVFWQQDVISAAARRVLGRRSRLVGVAAESVVEALEGRLLRRSDAVVAISEDFVPLLRRARVREDRIAVIENWAPLDELPLRPRDNDWAREHDLVGRTVFLYSGTLGFKHDPSLLLDLARWAGRNAACVVVVSEGVGSDWLAEHGADEPALRLLPYQPYERLPDVIASGDVLLMLLEPDAGAFSVPSKVLSYLCAGRPQLASVPPANLSARVIERSGGGLTVPPKDSSAFVAAAERLHGDPELRQELGRRARAYAETAFDIEAITDRFEEVLVPLSR
jgi:putative colanic acid biosynthesis glycosyltransferase WcaI